MHDAKTYHRKISTHNAGEYEKVETSMEIWGGEAKVLSHGVCVQAFPGRATEPNTYSFGCDVPPIIKKGFRDGKVIDREVVWPLGRPGVQEREGGKFAAIAILWCKRYEDE